MRRKILSIGAEPSLQLSRKMILEQAGFVVVSVADVQEGLAQCGEHRFGLFLVCQSVSEHEKLVLTRALRGKCPGIPILEMHSHDTPRVIGADYTVETVDGPEALVITVQRIFDKARATAAAARRDSRTA
jgi:DNA-binding NtrC family response regulator